MGPALMSSPACSGSPQGGDREVIDEGGLPFDPTMTELADALGCAAESVEILDRLSVTESADCRTDEGFVARIHRFEPEAGPEVRAFFEDRYTAGTTNPCDDGRPAASLAVVLGSTWAVVTPTDAEAEAVASELQAELLAVPGPDFGPPVSYSYPEEGFCAPP